MKKIIYILILIPMFVFGQNRKPTFIIVYSDSISVPQELLKEKAEYLKYEKNRDFERFGEKKISKKNKEKIENLSIEQIIGNVTLQSLQYYLYNSLPKGKYKTVENKDNTSVDKLVSNFKGDYLIYYKNLKVVFTDSLGLTLTFKFILYDINSKTYLINERFSADTNDPGGMWGCSHSRFKCLINNTIRIGVSQTSETIWKRIKK